MEENNVIARQFVSTTTCTKDDEGYWKVVAELHDRSLSEGDAEWVDEKFEVMSVDKDYSAAIQLVQNSTLNFLIEEVYNKGFSGLVELRAHERKLKEAKDAKSDTAKAEVSKEE